MNSNFFKINNNLTIEKVLNFLNISNDDFFKFNIKNINTLKGTIENFSSYKNTSPDSLFFFKS